VQITYVWHTQVVQIRYCQYPQQPDPGTRSGNLANVRTTYVHCTTLYRGALETHSQEGKTGPCEAHSHATTTFAGLLFPTTAHTRGQTTITGHCQLLPVLLHTGQLPLGCKDTTQLEHNQSSDCQWWSQCCQCQPSVPTVCS
jgi:hypothetical protein